MSSGLTPEFLDAEFGPKCDTCGWRRGQHRKALPGMGVEACPEGEAS